MMRLMYAFSVCLYDKVIHFDKLCDHVDDANGIKIGACSHVEMDG